MIVLGLTGSIGMGKSTTAQMFLDAGITVYSADETVHRLYRGEAASLIEQAFPGTTIDGEVDRARLSAAVMGKPEALQRLEKIVHPLVRTEENRFRQDAENSGAKLILLDIPLLFETGAEERVDKVLVVTAPEEVQRERVLARDGMTASKLDAILARQVPDAEKRARADFIIDTSLGLESAREDVHEIIHSLVDMSTDH